MTSQAAFLNAEIDMVSPVDDATYYERLLSVRSARDELPNRSGGGSGGRFLSIRR